MQRIPLEVIAPAGGFDRSAGPSMIDRLVLSALTVFNQRSNWRSIHDHLTVQSVIVGSIQPERERLGLGSGIEEVLDASHSDLLR